MSEATMQNIKTVDTNIVLDTSQPVVMSRRQLVAGLAAGSVVAISGCTTNPETGRSQLILVSEQQLAQLAAGSWRQLRQQEKVSRNPQSNAQVQRVGRRLAPAAGLDVNRMEFAVFDSEEKNAFVLPGGKVGFYEGILDIMDNDDQVAVVMGHEMGHVTGKHAAERFSQTIVAEVGLQAAAIALENNDVRASREIGAVLGLGVMFGLILPYSRKHELEADNLGIRYMQKAGYNPTQAVPFWQKMAGESKSRPPEFLSTHPDPATRIEAIRQQLRNMGYSA